MAKKAAVDAAMKEIATIPDIKITLDTVPPIIHQKHHDPVFVTKKAELPVIPRAPSPEKKVIPPAKKRV